MLFKKQWLLEGIRALSEEEGKKSLWDAWVAQ